MAQRIILSLFRKTGKAVDPIFIHNLKYAILLNKKVERMKQTIINIKETPFYINISFYLKCH